MVAAFLNSKQSIIYKTIIMKKIIITGMSMFMAVCVFAQTPARTNKAKADSVRLSRPVQHEPISSQPQTNQPTPAPMTNPTSNPVSGQTQEAPVYNQPVTNPPINTRPAVQPQRVDTGTSPVELRNKPGKK